MSNPSSEHEANRDSRPDALVRSAADLQQEDLEHEPRGTLVLLLLYLAVMVGVWLYVYFLLIQRH